MPCRLSIAASSWSSALAVSVSEPQTRQTILPFFICRLDGLDIDVVRVVVVHGAEPPAHDPLFGDRPVELDLDDVIELHPRLLQGLFERLGLGEVPGESIQEPAVLAVGLLEAVQDHGDGDRRRGQGRHGQ